MYGRFPQLSAFGKKFLEVCGAGLASAVVACLLGQTGKPEAPLAPVVYLAPADAQMMKLMHDDQTALLERLRTQPEASPEPATVASDVAVSAPVAAPVAAPAPLPQSVAAAPAHREMKPSRAPALAAAKRQPDDVPVVTANAGTASTNVTSSILPTPQALAPQALAPETIEPSSSPVIAAVEEAADWVSSLKQFPGRFWPTGGGLASTAPRPPMPVGNLLPHMM